MKLDKPSLQSESSNEYFDLDVTPILEKLKELSENNTYLELPSEDTLYYLQSLNYSNVHQGMKAQMETAFQTPLLKAQYKSDRGYSLIPTKHFCDIGKRISGIFDPFSGEDCSEGQYMDMLEDFQDSGLEIFLTLGDEGTLSLSVTQDGTSLQIDMSWDEENITHIHGKFLDAQTSYRGERHMSFDFVPQESFLMSAGDDDFDTSLSMSMDSNGNISSGEYILSVGEMFNISGIYQNKTL
jgi:hypothetical protein